MLQRAATVSCDNFYTRSSTDIKLLIDILWVNYQLSPSLQAMNIFRSCQRKFLGKQTLHEVMIKNNQCNYVIKHACQRIIGSYCARKYAYRCQEIIQNYFGAETFPHPFSFDQKQGFSVEFHLFSSCFAAAEVISQATVAQKS